MYLYSNQSTNDIGELSAGGASEGCAEHLAVTIKSTQGYILRRCTGESEEALGGQNQVYLNICLNAVIE
jgi:hypothetical protein